MMDILKIHVETYITAIRVTCDKVKNSVVFGSYFLILLNFCSSPSN